MIKDNFQQYIRKIILKRDDIESFDIYPFSLKSVRCLDNIELHPNVTFLIGENGSGKSTLLEAIAVAYGFNPEGGTKNFNFSTAQTHSNLYEYIKLVKGAIKAKDGFFLRAESFYNVASNIQELDQSGIGSRIIDSYGGISLHNQSHGESFMAVLLNRLGGNGVYIFDEPEAALSPTRQMALISRIHELVNQDSQFIIATHSPIIMSYPNSKIYSFDDGFKEVQYEDTEHYQVTKRFMNNTSKMLDILLDNE